MQWGDNMSYELLSKLYYKSGEKYHEECINRRNSVSAVRLPLTIHDNEVFYVNTNEMMLLQERIYLKTAKLRSLSERLPSAGRYFCMRHCILEEVCITNNIEGVSSNRNELSELYRNINDQNSKSRFKGLMLKYLKLTDYNHVIPLRNSRDLRNLYNEIILPEISPEDIPDGEIFRRASVSVMTVTDRVCHTGVHGEKNIIMHVDNMLGILRSRIIPSLVQIAVIHYYFGYIHPFYDGNGRMSRFISSYLIGKVLNPLISYRLSYTIQERKREYYKAFDDCNNTKNFGDITSFIVMFLDIICSAVYELTEKLERITSMLDYFWVCISRIFPQNSRHKSILFILVQSTLFDNESLDTEAVSSASGIPESSVRIILKELSEIGVPLSVQKSGRRNVYKLKMPEFEAFCKDFRQEKLP